MEITQQTKQIQVRQVQVPTLPLSVVNSLPQILRAQITQKTLKQFTLTDPNEIEKFIIEAIERINVNMADPDLEFPLLQSHLRAYAEQSLLTPAEFFEARTALSRGLLKDFNGETLRPFKKIDFEIFNQVEVAYIEYRNNEKQYELGRQQIKAFLNPPTPELTEEEKKANKATLIDNVKNCISQFGECEFAFLIYDDFKELPEFQIFRERAKVIQNRLMLKFFAKEKDRNIFYNKLELLDLKEKFDKGEKYKMPGLVFQQTKNQIVENYLKSLKDETQHNETTPENS